MKQVITHPWPANEVDAIELQTQLALLVEREDRLSAIHKVAGVDVAYDKHSDRIIAAVVVLDVRTLEVLTHAIATDTARFPYIPGLFSFRELPPIVSALQQLDITPDLIVCDGQGIAHPRRFGLACHLGVLFDVPTIGCGKSRLIGKEAPTEIQRGATAPLWDNEEIVGCTLRTQDNIKPVYVSVGHRISLVTACEWILKLSPKYRLPETTRHADQKVKAILTLNNLKKIN